MKKSRDYVNSSSLGSYFGVGFNTPNEQIEIDLGIIEAEFDEAAQDRLLLGRVMEDSALDYFEQKLGIKIDKRNEELMTGLEGRLVGKIDGFTVLNDLPTVVENKISNSQSGPFTENMGYVLQCQAYMLMTSAPQALLCGIYQGKPIMKIIKRDEDIISDITEIVEFVHEVLTGLESFENYPRHILEKYSKVQILETLDNFDSKDEEAVNELITLKEKQKVLEGRIKVIEAGLKEKFEAGKFENDYYSFALSEGSRKGGLDEFALSIDYPDLDLSKYRKPESKFKTIRIKGK